MIEHDLVRPAPGADTLHFGETDWMAQAACVDAGFGWDYDAGADGSDRASQHAAAIAICQTCPVLALCATYADENDLVGVWGGKCHGDNFALGSQVACGSCHRDAQLIKSTDLTRQRRARNAAAERARYAAMSEEEKAARRAKRYATPELREAARVRHLAWKARRSIESKNHEKVLDAERYQRRKVAASC